MSRDVAVVIGTVVGAYFGDAGMGYAIGSMVGNAYDPVKIGKQGPRLGDLKVQTSDYGKMIPVLYGASRFAGNVIWSTDIRETQHTEDSGGKGGGPVTTSTTYTYSQSFAVALCEGEVDGIGKIWANGKLIYNNSADATAADVAAGARLAASMRFYPGSETQTADSLIQSYVGATDTPAYRGIAYVVFEDLQLADFGNRMPNLEFEALEAATIAHPEGERVDYAVGSVPHGVAFDSVTNSIWVANYGSDTLSKVNIFTGERVDYAVADRPFGVAFDSVTNSIWVSNYSSATVSKVNIFTGARTDYAVGSVPYGVAFDSVTNSIWVANNNSGTVSKVNIFTGTRVDYAVGVYPMGIAFDSVTNSIWVANNGSGTVSKVNIFTGTRVDYAVGVYPHGVEFDSVTNSIWVSNYGPGTVSKVNIFTGTRVDYAVGAYPRGVAFDSVTNSIWVSNYNSGTVSKVNIFTGTRVDYAGVNSPLGIAFDSVTNSIWVSNYSTATVSKVNIHDYGLTSSDKTLSSVVSDICERAGLTIAQIDATQLTDTITGYVTQRSTARVRIEQLMQAFYFDAVESDGKVKFVKRGGATTLTISEDDLAAHLYGGTMPDNLMIDRQQEMELPVEVNVQYMDTAAAYQINSQRSQRLITDSSNKMTLNFAISMSASKAKQISDVLMFDAWTARTAFNLDTGWKYSYLEPTDVVGVTKGAYTYNVRIQEEDAGVGVSKRGAVLEDSSVYTQTANAAYPIAPSTTVSSAPLLNLVLMDIPLLRDQDDAVGFYAAACAYSGAWVGEQTYRSNDSGATWAQSGRAILNEAAIGSASTALGDFTGGNIFDESNSVTVVLINGTLSSDTEINVLNGSNVILIGSEILQFKNATLSAADTYILTGLLRGRRGTEWAMSTHAIGDRVVLLSSTTTYIFESGSSEYNLARQYRGVAIGGFVEDALTQSFTNTAVAQECYSPVQLGGGRNAANDVLLRWTRRTRIGGAWNDYADVPLGETTEAYVVEIYSNSAYATLLRTISGLTSATTTYTAAQQTTDGLTPGNPVHFIVYQVSALVGNGYGARGVV